MKRIPDLTDAEYNSLAQVLDVYIKSVGLNGIETAYKLLKVLVAAQDVSDKSATSETEGTDTD